MPAKKPPVPQLLPQGWEEELSQWESHLGKQLAKEAQQLVRRFPPNPQGVLSRVGLALASRAGGTGASGSRRRWIAAAGVFALVAGSVAGWWSAAREATAPRLSAPAGFSRPSSLPLDAHPSRQQATETLPPGAGLPTVGAPPGTELVSSEALEGISDLEQPGFEMGI